jgi:hypothetical protein
MKMSDVLKASDVTVVEPPILWRATGPPERRGGHPRRISVSQTGR